MGSRNFMVVALGLCVKWSLDWSRVLKCSLKSYVTGPSTICYFNELLLMQGFSHMIISKKSTIVKFFGAPW